MEAPVPRLVDLTSFVEASSEPDMLRQLQTAKQLSEILQGMASRLIQHFVEEALLQGSSWAEIGNLLSVSEQAARNHYRIPPGELPLSNEAHIALQEAFNNAEGDGRGIPNARDLLIGILSAPTFAGRGLQAVDVSLETLSSNSTDWDPLKLSTLLTHASTSAVALGFRRIYSTNVLLAVLQLEPKILTMAQETPIEAGRIEEVLLATAPSRYDDYVADQSQVAP